MLMEFRHKRFTLMSSPVASRHAALNASRNERETRCTCSASSDAGGDRPLAAGWACTPGVLRHSGPPTE